MTKACFAIFFCDLQHSLYCHIFYDEKTSTSIIDDILQHFILDIDVVLISIYALYYEYFNYKDCNCTI